MKTIRTAAQIAKATGPRAVRLEQLRRMAKVDLRAVVRSGARVVDLRDASKDVLIGMILAAEF